MPPHYAISEGFIVLAALYCGWKLGRNSQWFGAIGVLLFGAAASIGVYRFPSGQVAEFASLHKWAGQMGGLTGMGLIAIELLVKDRQPSKSSRLKCVLLLLLFGTLLIANLKAALAVPFFLMWSVASIIGALALPASSVFKRMGFALIVSLMLLNVIFIRQSPSLDQDTSWHAFHTLIAVWIFGAYWTLKRTLNHG